MSKNGIRVPRIRPTGNVDQDAFQKDVRDSLEKLSNEKLLENVILSNVVIGTSNTRVPHGLGRVPLGWYVIDRTNGTANPVRVSWDSQYITFIALANITVSFFVF